MISFLDQGSGVKAGVPTDVSYFFELIFTFFGAKVHPQGHCRTGHSVLMFGPGFLYTAGREHVMRWKKRCCNRAVSGPDWF